MSSEDFLKRWARRKREAGEAAKPSAEPSDESSSAESSASSADAPAAPPAVVAAKPEDVFDPATLPSLDSISALTDVTGFLQKGVPLELGRAALRRAWAADPAIRDFVGLAENAWDFNDPTAMPGFGPLEQTPEQVRELVARIMGEVRSLVEPEAEPAADGTEDGTESVVADDSPSPTGAEDDARDEASAVSPPALVSVDERIAMEPSDRANRAAGAEEKNAAVQKESAVSEGDLVPGHRSHGGALPR